MDTALKGVPESTPTAPAGVVNVGGEWYYDEYAPGAAGGGVSSLGISSTAVGEPVPVTQGGMIGTPPTMPIVPGPSSPAPLANADGQPPAAPKAAEERRSLLDLFRN
jgi:penicillin-binding protein 1A